MVIQAQALSMMEDHTPIHQWQPISSAGIDCCPHLRLTHVRSGSPILSRVTSLASRAVAGGNSASMRAVPTQAAK